MLVCRVLYLKQLCMELSDLILLFLCLQVQLPSADCLRLTQQQLLGMLQRSHHVLNTRKQRKGSSSLTSSAWIYLPFEM